MIPIYFVHTHPYMPLDTYGIRAYPLSFTDGERVFGVPKLGASVEPAQGPANIVSTEEANKWLGKLDWLKDAKMAICRWDYAAQDDMLQLTVWTLPEALPGLTDLDAPEWYKPSSVLGRMTEAVTATSVRRDAADKAAAVWLDTYIAAKEMDRDRLTKADWFLLTREVPCEIRCWRIGEAVEVSPGESCPECGKMRPAPSVWDRILDES